MVNLFTLSTQETEQISDSALCVTRLENTSFRAGVVLYYANFQNYQQENA